ncbi:hypothetical protein C0J52_16880 [Blattella germanica]|nr:hypothetical protein C0J52_16880 [Blattella germanica]
MVTSIRWIKNTMMKLMKDEKLSDYEGNLNNVQFTASNLDLYALSQEIDLVTDPICLRSKWPWILQPESQLLSLWNAFILLIVAVCAVILPYYATFVCTPMKYREDPKEVPNCHNVERVIILQVLTATFFTLDVIVQVLTAVRLKDGNY